MSTTSKRVTRTGAAFTESAVKRAIAAREARDSLIRFTKFTMPHPADLENADMSRYMPAEHHRLIAEKLEAVERGDILRLIITIPPRHGKTELTSDRFTAWFIGRDPYREVMLATYNQTFAEDRGRKIRDIMQSPEYAQVFPEARLKKDSKAADRLGLTDGGVAFFLGVGGSATGRGADLFTIDDPFKNREDAESPATRDAVWSWFTSSAFTRLLPGGRMVIILTRWHEDDIVGRIQNPDYVDPEEAAKWEIFTLPAIANDDDALGRKKGDALWPARYPVETLTSIRRTIGPRDWSALYQQSPTPDDGQYFLRTMFKPYQMGEFPAAVNRYGASDHALGTKQQNDASVLGTAGVDNHGSIWIPPDVVWGRLPPEEAVEAMLDQLRRNKPIFWWAEKGHISQSIGPFLRERMRNEQVYAAIEEMTPSKDKLTRARSIMARAAMSPIRVPAFMPWWPDALDQLLKFPNGKHDDFVDWLSWIGIGLDGISAMETPVVVPIREYRPGSAAWVITQGREASRVLKFQKRTAGW
jgi:predicted phage terminase large subunit-like protein